MAGVKITDLPLITEAASNDLLYIVDVSNVSQSPQGTSSQIEVENLFSSGTYIPTITQEINLTAFPIEATYIRIGNIVNVSVQMSINLNPLQNSGGFDISLPFSSDFTSEKQCFGIFQNSYGGQDLANVLSVTIACSTIRNTCYVLVSTSVDEANLDYSVVTFQYQIV
jgi:hypothetical protein